MENRKRNIQMKFYVTEEEKRLIDEKMKQLPIKQYGAYLAHFAEGDTLGKLGVFFLGQACLDYPASVGRVVSFHGCEPPFVGGFFQAAQAAKGGLGVATPTRFP